MSQDKKEIKLKDTKEAEGKIERGIPSLEPKIEQSIKKGAEADIFLGSMLGKEVIVKKRVEKSYRLKELDLELRRERTRAESRLISEVRLLGVSTPIIYDIDLDRFTIVMEHIRGTRLKEYFNSDVRDEEKISVAHQVGIAIGKLHSNDIVHGDLTTSNMLLSEDKVYFIDFSLGGKSIEIEDKGVDLHLLLEAFQSTHSKAMFLFDEIIKAYSKEYCYAEKAILKMHEIAKRGRYT